MIAPFESPQHAATLRAMHARIRHRGPDDERAAIFDQLGDVTLLRDVRALDQSTPFCAGMAFRRLKIVDLSEASSQPMASHDGKLWIVFNGEIYNFRELARELVAHGYAFESRGDTEVILAAYEEWGTDCFAKFEGMWAIVVIDLRERRIVASRDRFGIKPLYYAVHRQCLLFASEIKQLLPLTKDFPVDLEMVRNHLAGIREPVLREGFWLGIHSVPPAMWLEVPMNDPAREPRFATYWSLDDFTADRGRAYAASLAETRETVRQAVSSHLVSDVPLGSLLSGGLDSAIITSLIADERGSTFPTFSFGFRQAAPEVCELSFVDEIAAMKSLMNFETTFDPKWVIENARRAVYAMEEPPMAFAAIAQFRTFELVAQRGATVVLDGQGADEIFAGYPYHERDLVLDRLGRGQLFRVARELRSIGQRHSRSTGSVALSGLVAPWIRRWFPRRYDWLRGTKERIDFTNFDGARDASRLNRRLHFDVKWGNVRLVLGLGDRNSMAHSVESRVPYFDRRVVELAFSLPDDFKIANGERKHILRDLAREMLPRSLTDRRDRMGYAAPTERFLRGPLRDWARALVGDTRFTSAVFHRARMLRFVDNFFAGKHRDAHGVWRLVSLALWQDTFDAELR